jgi:hypothetical protein
LDKTERRNKMKKLTLLIVMCLTVMLAAMPFVAFGAPAEEPVYTVLDPRSSEPPRPYFGMAPRIDTLEGKKIIVVNLRGGNEEAILSVGPALQEAFPTAEVTTITTAEGWRVSPAEWELIESQDAVIFGHDY